ncbi:unnamed protein product [Arabidopsis halleri]
MATTTNANSAPATGKAIQTSSPTLFNVNTSNITKLNSMNMYLGQSSPIMELPWLISISRQNHEEKVLVIAEDYATLYKVNERWPGHAVLIPPALDPQAAHKFGSQGFFNLTSRRPQHLLNILELGYNVMYNDVDMVLLQDPFQYLQGSHDAYFMDDMIAIKPLNHSHGLPPRSRGGVTYVCSCMIFLRSTDGAKLLMKTWVRGSSTLE